MAKKSDNNSKEGILGSTWAGLQVAWREIVRVSTRANTPDESDPDTIRTQIRACLNQKGGEVSARNRAAGLARSYLGFSPEERLEFLKILNHEFGADGDLIAGAVDALQGAETEAEIELARYRLRKALEPARVQLLREFNTLHSGPRFLVELRRELIDLVKEHPDLSPLERDLKELLRSWFDVGFLELSNINWNSPASLLEKLGRYEAVHKVRSWRDLKNRLDSDRRCFAFFHPCMPDEPLIFIEVALVKGLAVQIQSLLDEKMPVLEPDEADTAIFYSISNAQKGLVGVSFGNFLIKQVVNRLRRELPNLKRFSTLSPIPGYLNWLKSELAAERIKLLPAEAKALKPFAADAKPVDFLANALKGASWHRDNALSDALKPVLLRYCAIYLQQAKRPGRRTTLDPVAHFHLTNGARIEQLNWMGDTSPKGMQESAGIMINYLYRLDRIERYHEDYHSEGKVNASKPVIALQGKVDPQRYN
ncbi:malonyl-CoA decarboxylase [Pelagicoccus sp. SDUM812005]|uniref:malonyl-CoA decarboxylase n=1 Tax=Pelagicoccus sp. SDUM812005 TaxID=3041257 RepID=UPI00280DD268|nr:malonyl-CoA decarboxylase [Pelagicoccus sp. SDUM812005]MDQ8183029.1 malonyl-CoA decarboxylase [Pelagicoccus sp. SDUM812005]